MTMTTTTFATMNVKRSLSNRTQGLRRSILAWCLLLGASSLTLSGCVGEAGQSQDERVYDAKTGEVTSVTAGEAASTKGAVRLVSLGLEQSASRRNAGYLVHTSHGKQFKTTVSHRIQRDGADEVVTAEDVETGAITTWTFGAESAQYTNAAGQVATITGDDDAMTLTIQIQGSPTTIDFSTVAEGSAAEQTLLDLTSVTLMGMAAFEEDQIEALSAALAAGDADLGASSMGWGWLKKAAKTVAKGLKTAYCSSATTFICGTVAEAGLDATLMALECPPVAAGAAVVTVLATGCVVGQLYACN
jgi:hypothetical protein